MITIVIPVYNREKELPATLASIDSQTVAPERVILVDNGSTDSSLSIITEWAASRPNVTVLSEPLGGVCAARNRGLREVTSEWTMFFDSDDIMHPNHLADFTDAIRSYPDNNILGRDVMLHFPDGSTRRGYFALRLSPVFWNFFRGSFATLRYIARTSLFRSVGGWDVSVRGWNDLELGFRLLLAGGRPRKIKGQPSVSVTCHPESITGRNRSDDPDKWEHALATVRADFESLPLSHPKRQLWLGWCDARTMILAAEYEREAARSSSPEEAAYRHQLSRRLYGVVISRCHSTSVMKLFYDYYRCVGRYVWPLVALLRNRLH